MKSDSTTVIKNMEFLVKELHKEWDRSGASKASVIISFNLSLIPSTSSREIITDALEAPDLSHSL